MIDPLVFYKSLADDTRLKSVLLISKLGETCVCDLMAILQLSQPKVSRHLAELRKAGILCGERRGKWVYYSLNPKLPEWVSNVISLCADSNDQYLLPLLDGAKLGSTCMDMNT